MHILHVVSSKKTLTNPGILIMVVLIGLVVIFKKQLNDLVKKIFQKINKDSNSIISALPHVPQGLV